MANIKPTSKGPSMVVIAEKLDHLTTTIGDVSDTVTEIRDKQLKNDVHMENIIGPPSLEDRMRDYINVKVEHKNNNNQQHLMQVQTILQLEQKNAKLELEAKLSAVELAAANTEKERLKNHEENGERFTKLERIVYMGMGGLVVAEFILKLIWK